MLVVELGGSCLNYDTNWHFVSIWNSEVAQRAQFDWNAWLCIVRGHQNDIDTLYLTVEIMHVLLVNMKIEKLMKKICEVLTSLDNAQ